jgi:hypothetical protein
MELWVKEVKQNMLGSTPFEISPPRKHDKPYHNELCFPLWNKSIEKDEFQLDSVRVCWL